MSWLAEHEETNEKVTTDWILVHLKNVGPTFFKFVSVYAKMLVTQLENHSNLLCG